MSAVIEMHGVSKRFGAAIALDEVSLTIRENEFYALLGPSGCGKTTLLRVIAGFETPDEGDVSLDGKDLLAIRPNRRPVNMMFQSYALFPHLNVFNNVAYGLRMDRVRGSELEQRTQDALAMVQLDGLESRRPNQLSGGQRQRVALARALVKHPRVLLLDEPLGSLDKKLRGQMQIELKRLQHAVGITFIVVTHDQEEALEMADRIALMRDGRIEQEGTPEELYERPANHFVADFIGDMNFFAGTRAADGVRLETGTILRGHGDAGAESPAWLAVRPEKIALSAERPARAEDNALEAEVVDISYSGQHLSIRLRVPEADALVLAKVDTADPNVAGIERGQALWCYWPPSASRILPRESQSEV